MKLGVIGGAGRLGATTAFCVGLRDCVEEIKLLDVKENFAAANVMDMSQAFLPVSRTKVTLAKDYSDFADCGIILSAASKPFSEDIKDRAQELRMNVDIIAPICEQLKKYCSPSTVVIVSANPVDVFVYIYQQLLGWNKKQFLGLAGNDTIRLKWAAEMVTGKEYGNIGGVCIGEHGGGAVRLYESMTYGSLPLEFTEGQQAEIEKECGDWFGHWTDLKTGTTTSYTSGVTMSMMIEAIAKDNNLVIPCSTPLCEQMGYPTCSMGLPVKLGKGGAKEVIVPRIPPEKKQVLDEVAEKISGMIASVL